MNLDVEKINRVIQRHSVKILVGFNWLRIRESDVFL
jgi:hypothetical protein